MTPQVRDRMMQVFLAQARGPVRNGDLLRQAVDRALRMRAVAKSADGREPVDDALLDTLGEVAAALDRLCVPYAVTGTVAASFHSEPCSSLVIELLLNAFVEQASDIARALSPRFYAPEDMLTEAAAKHTFVNVVDNRTSLKADLSFIDGTGFLGEALARRVEGADR